MDEIKMHHYVNLIILACISVVPLVFVPFGEYYDYFYEPKSFMLTILSAFFLIILLKNRNKLVEMFQIDEINTYLFFYFLLVSISIFFALDIKLAILGRPYRVDGYSTILTYFLLFITSRSSKLTIKSLSNALLITASILSIYGIFQYFGIDPFPRDFIREKWKLTFATFGNPNFMASYLVMMIPFAINAYIKEQKNIGLIIYTILFFCLLCTRTRGSWIGVTIAILSYFVFSFSFSIHTKPMLIRHAIIVFLTIIIISSFNQISNGGFTQRFTSISSEAAEVLNNGDNAEKGGGSRIFIWRRVIELIKERPFFGFGIENLAEPFVEKYETEMIEKYGYILFVDKAHNEYLHIAVTTGIPSLLVYLIFILQVLKSGVKQLSVSSKHWPIIAALVGYLSQAFFNISVVSVAYIFWILLGLASNYEEKI